LHLDHNDLNKKNGTYQLASDKDNFIAH